MTRRPHDEVLMRLMRSVIETRVALRFQVPEISDWQPKAPDHDFRMTFRQLKELSFVPVAEYTNGDLVCK